MNFNAIVDRLSKVQRVQRLAAYGATILLVAVGVFSIRFGARHAMVASHGPPHPPGG